MRVAIVVATTPFKLDSQRESRALRWNGTSADARRQVRTAVSCVPPNRAYGSLRRVRCHFAAALTNHEGFHGKYRPSGIGKAEGNTDGGCKALTRDAMCKWLIAPLFTPSRSLLLTSRTLATGRSRRSAQPCKRAPPHRSLPLVARSLPLKVSLSSLTNKPPDILSSDGGGRGKRIGGRSGRPEVFAMVNFTLSQAPLDAPANAAS